MARLWKSVRTSDEMASIARNLDRNDFSGHHERILFAILFKVIRDEKLKEEDPEREVRVKTGRREEGEQQESSPYGLTVKQKKVTIFYTYSSSNLCPIYAHCYRLDVFSRTESIRLVDKEL